MLYKRSKRRLQELVITAENAFTERVLLLDENKLSFGQNNESRTRASTRSTVIGKAKVISYEDIIEAQRKRDIKETNTGGKARRGHKRKVSESKPMAPKRLKKNELEVAE